MAKMELNLDQMSLISGGTMSNAELGHMKQVYQVHAIRAKKANMDKSAFLQWAKSNGAPQVILNFLDASYDKF